MAEEYSIVFIYHIFFIHYSVDGHLGCFYFPAIVNSAAVNIEVHVSFWIMGLQGEVMHKEKIKYHILTHICGI